MVQVKMKHEYFMKRALNEAEKARQHDEVPVGAVLISSDGEILSCAWNQTIHKHDPTAHAEILALRKAAQKIKNYRLLDTILYVTLEPCIMCMGAIVHARVKQVVFGAYDLKWGGAGSILNLATEEKLNHNVEIVSGVCESDCRNIIQTFFREKRKSVARKGIMP
ncbi:MAG: tRNA adenosine(34) deaminase TadA [Desulfobacterales bacterium]